MLPRTPYADFSQHKVFFGNDTFVMCICFHITLAILRQNPRTKKSQRTKNRKRTTWETGGLTALLSVYNIDVWKAAKNPLCIILLNIVGDPPPLMVHLPLKWRDEDPVAFKDAVAPCGLSHKWKNASSICFTDCPKVFVIETLEVRHFWVDKEEWKETNRRKFRSLTSDNMASWKAEWQSGQVSRKEINTRVESLDRRYIRAKC